MFDALLLRQADGKTTARIESLSPEQLPAGDVRVAVEYSSLNYKDALAITGKAPIVRSFPFVPGIDLAGRVVESASPRFAVGDPVLLTGWGVGEKQWGGMAQQARVNGDWLLPLPAGLDTRTAMRLGTAGLTAALCVMALEQHGIDGDAGPVLVTGASGGVGSIAVALLRQTGHEVHAATGKPSAHDYLKRLGAAQIVERRALLAPARPLESQRWAGVIDSCGGTILARALAETRHGGCVAACGLAADHRLETTVMPFILRGVTLQGIDSVYCPMARRHDAWQRLAERLPERLLSTIGHEIGLDEVPAMAAKLLDGKLRGRLVVAVG